MENVSDAPRMNETKAGLSHTGTVYSQGGLLLGKALPHPTLCSHQARCPNTCSWTLHPAIQAHPLLWTVTVAILSLCPSPHPCFLPSSSFTQSSTLGPPYP